MRPARSYSTSSDGHGGRIAVAAIATASGVVALFSYHTSPGQTEALAQTPQTAPVADVAAAADPGVAADPGAADPGAADPGAADPGAADPGAAAEPAASPTRQRKAQRAGAGGEYLGTSVETRWGPVQVKITVRNGKIVQATAPVSPNSTQTSVSINRRALPILNAAAVKAGSAGIDAVSGATVTSEGYVQSLQSAIDQANL